MAIRPDTNAGRDPADRRTAQLAALRWAVFESVGTTEPAVRAAAGTGGDLPEPVASFAATVRDRSYRVTDREFAAMADAELSDDAVFEITVAAAVGAALDRLDAGLRAMRGQV